MKKEKIMQFAQELFLKKGFSNVPIEEITKAAGISKGSFYTYFKSKDALLEEIAYNSIKSIKSELLGTSKEVKNPVSALDNFLKTNIKVLEIYISGILITMREVSFVEIKNSELSTMINDKIRETLRDFILSLKGNCSEEDVTLLWGVMLSVWIRVGIEHKNINTNKLALKLWKGLGGD